MARKPARKKSKKAKGGTFPNRRTAFAAGIAVGTLTLSTGLYLTDLGRDFSAEGIQARAVAVVDVLPGLDRSEDTPQPLPPVPFAIPAAEGGIVLGGWPVPTEGITILSRTGFVVGYDEARDNPAWVAYKLAGQPAFPSGERPERFTIDRDTKARVGHDDYTGTGFDRGHMAPNFAICTYYGPEAQAETFRMSNVVPQDPDLNQGPWRLLEEQIATTYTERFDAVYVMTGPIYDGDVEWLPKRNPADSNEIEIPDAFFQVIVGQKGPQLEVMAVVMPQEAPRDVPWTAYLQTVDEVERLSGFDFLSDLPDALEFELEARDPRVW